MSGPPPACQTITQATRDCRCSEKRHGEGVFFLPPREGRSLPYLFFADFLADFFAFLAGFLATFLVFFALFFTATVAPLVSLG